MLRESDCYKRHCKHYLGISQPDGTELTERHYCRAFPDGIPADISYKGVKHLTPYPGQKNTIVYEKGKFEWEDDAE